MQDSLQYAPPSREAAGPYFPAGAAARLHKRTLEDTASTTLNLAHSIHGFSQVAALQVRPRCCAKHCSLAHVYIWTVHAPSALLCL